MKQHFLYSEGGGFTPQIAEDPAFVIVDLFCGAGGTTTGFDLAQIMGRKATIIAACVNHDKNAIKSHWENHPEVVHFEEDIRKLDLTALVEIIAKYRILYPGAKIILWASLECTNFSKAKGGQPRDADSRTLADHLERYVKALDPDYVQIENVVEFMSWGPLDEHGKPVSKRSGRDWLRWRGEIYSFGYRDEWRELNSADFGAYTSRNRLFGCFAKHGLPIVWPTSTHAKKPINGGMFGNVEKWKAVKDVLDFEDEGKSIFTRSKPLSPKTLERIYAGLIKYVAGGNDAFLLKWNSMAKGGNYVAPSVDQPCPVISTQNRLGVCFIAKYYSGKPENMVGSVNDPCPTLRTKDGSGLVQCFLMKYFSNGGQWSSVDAPAGALTTKDRMAKVWLDSFILNGNFGHDSSIKDPSPVLTASRRHHYIVNPSHGGHSTSIDAPCPVIIARQDKAPLYLIGIEAADVAIPVYEDDPEIMVKIKEFMALYGISDIKIRMLKVPELLRIQGFPAGYKLAGNQSDQKKFIGNSVVPHVVKAWCEAMAGKLMEERVVA